MSNIFRFILVIMLKVILTRTISFKSSAEIISRTRGQTLRDLEIEERENNS